MHSKKAKEKMRLNSKKGEECYNWKGDNAGYNAIHNWVTRQVGQPRFCKICKRTDRKRYEWSNISGQYKRDLSDYERLCNSCHQKKDEKIYIIKKNKYKKLKKDQVSNFLTALGFIVEE